MTTPSALTRTLAALALAALALAALPVTTASAQRLTGAAGPAMPLLFSFDAEPGAHARLGVALREGAPWWNVEVEGYYTRWQHSTSFYGSRGEEVSPRDLGATLTGTLAVFPNARLSPFVRAGAGYNSTDETIHRLEADAFGTMTRTVTSRYRSSFVGLVLGTGANVRVGAHALRVEARLQGGWDVNMPVTVGFAF